MTIINQNNFDWSITNRDVVMVIPNYGRKNLILPGLKRFKTGIPRDKWILLIANDCKHEDFSDIAEEFNIAWFTFEREPVERNGSQIRNFIIKNIQSKILAFRDPEIIVTGEDYLEKVIGLKERQVHRPYGTTELREQDVTRILRDNTLDVTTLDVKRNYKVGDSQAHEGFHFCYAAHVSLLREIRGYDEDYKDCYGWEDVDLLNRLHLANAEFVMDKNIHAYHTWHPRRRSFLKGVHDNAKIYTEKITDPIKIVNPNGWGLG